MGHSSAMGGFADRAGRARFADRADGGRRLAARLADADLAEPLVLGLPRGGVPVAYEVAAALGAPLDVFVARKVGAPTQPELGIGAIAEGDGVVADTSALAALGLSPRHFDELVAAERRELDDRVRRYRGSRSLPGLGGHDVVLVDDGLATGLTAEVALRALAARRPRRLVLAVPTCAPSAARRLEAVADEVVSVLAPAHFQAVGQWYEDFAQTTDEEVLSLLARAGTAVGPPAGAPVVTPVVGAVRIPLDGGALDGDLVVPQPATGLVVFAHGSGSSRHSPRNRAVATRLGDRGLATLLVDLLTSPEEAEDLRTRRLRFDIGLLAERLVAVADWCRVQPTVGPLALGLFGASTGAAAALVAATRRPGDVAAVVSRGGRPDLAGGLLAAVAAPTLLVVGSDDHTVVDLNRQALARLGGERALEVVAGATHLFEEPGALDAVARLAGDWFVRHLGPATPGP